jgi:hypothetical protein
MATVDLGGLLDSINDVMAIEPDEAAKLIAAVTAIAKEDGLETATGQTVSATGDVIKVVEGRDHGLKLWVQSAPLSGHEDPRHCTGGSVMSGSALATNISGRHYLLFPFAGMDLKYRLELSVLAFCVLGSAKSYRDIANLNADTRTLIDLPKRLTQLLQCTAGTGSVPLQVDICSQKIHEHV